jgi:AcrR family transcriptional regulator
LRFSRRRGNIVTVEREALLSAAQRLLARDARDPLRVDDVLGEARLSTRAFYRHFHGRTELFLALLAAETARAAERLDGRLARAATPEDKVRTWVQVVLALAYDSRLAARARLFAGERATLAREFPTEVEQCVRTQLAPLEDVIAAGRDEGAFPAADPVADARAVHHLCAGLMADKLWGSGAMSRERAVALATGFALQTLRADGDERRPAREAGPLARPAREAGPSARPGREGQPE